MTEGTTSDKAAELAETAGDLAQWLPETPDASGTRSFVRDVENSPRQHVNTFMTAVLAAILIAMMGFVVLPLPNPVDWFDALFFNGESVQAGRIHYAFQLPFVLFAGALLGPVPGLVAVLLFIASGLFGWPVFAGGGGLDYFSRPGFGYLLGMAAGAWVCGRSIRQVLARPRDTFRPARRSIQLMGVGITGVLAVHLTGIVYMLALTLLGHQPLHETNHWVLYLSLAPLLYDLTTAMIFMCFVRYMRLALWPALY